MGEPKRRHLLGCNGVAWRICRPECECWCHEPVCPICGERIPLPPGPRQPNGNCVVTGPGSGGTRADGSLIDDPNKDPDPIHRVDDDPREAA